jgi:hypothetical protein
MQPAVVVEIGTAEASSPSVQALLASCDVGMHGRARCVLARDPSAASGAAFASVTWEGPDGAQASVEVRLPRPGGEQRMARDLSFSESDPAIERWRATGFAIATVVGDIIDARDPAEPAPATPAAPARSEAPARPIESHARRASWWLDGRATAAVGAQDSPAALGGELGISRPFGEGPWFLTASLGCSAQTSHGADIVRPGASLGVGLLALRVWGGAAIALRVQPRLEYIDATARDGSGATGQAGRWAPGLGQALDAAWMASDAFGLVGGAEVRELAGPTAIQGHGQLLALVPAVDFLVHAGVRYGLP